jgi:hypothetical protein
LAVCCEVRKLLVVLLLAELPVEQVAAVVEALAVLVPVPVPVVLPAVVQLVFVAFETTGIAVRRVSK